MSMKSNDLTAQQKEAARAAMRAAFEANDTEAFSSAFEQMMGALAEGIRSDYDDLREAQDVQALAARGIRQLTSEERTYYQRLGEAMNAKDPKQALANLDVVMPKTIEEDVFDGLRQNHPLLSKINFVPTGGIAEFITRTGGTEYAIWGQLTDEIKKELSGGFVKQDMTLCKLSAFISISKPLFELGPEWVDRFHREMLSESIANGTECGIVDGDGKDMPIGMTRQVGEGVTVTGGVYPKKTPIKVTSFDPVTVGNLLSMLAVDDRGLPRVPESYNPVLLCNPQDYYQLVRPAVMMQTPSGAYVRSQVLPETVEILPTIGFKTERGKAILGLARRYFLGLGSAKTGNIDFDDSYRFLEDERVYLAKMYGNGFPRDNSAFLLLDISELQPCTYKMVTVAPGTPANNADLSALSVGSLELSPAFDAATKTYSATTTNATNTVLAVPADIGAKVAVKFGGAVVENGKAITWAAGANTVTVEVTAADGTTTNTYTVTVTKS